jgi:hypothetical protein
MSPRASEAQRKRWARLTPDERTAFVERMLMAASAGRAAARDRQMAGRQLAVKIKNGGANEHSGG